MNKVKFTKEYIKVLDEYGLGSMERDNLSLLKYKSGEFICLQGNGITYLYIFVAGKAKVFFTSPNGKTLLMAYYTEKGIVGDTELMADKKVATSSVQAITDVTCIGIPLNAYKDYLVNNLIFMKLIGAELANKLHSSTIRSNSNILNSLDIRLCAYIAMTNTDGYFKEKLTELSEIMGTSYRHLLRTLDRLCSEGLLQKTKRGYLILDKEEFQRKADEYYK